MISGRTRCGRNRRNGLDNHWRRQSDVGDVNNRDKKHICCGSRVAEDGGERFANSDCVVVAVGKNASSDMHTCARDIQEDVLGGGHAFEAGRKLLLIAPLVKRRAFLGYRGAELYHI